MDASLSGNAGVVSPGVEAITLGAVCSSVSSSRLRYSIEFWRTATCWADLEDASASDKHNGAGEETASMSGAAIDGANGTSRGSASASATQSPINGGGVKANNDWPSATHGCAMSMATRA